MDEESETRYRVKECTVDAVQWTGSNTTAVEALTGRGNFDAVDEQDRANSDDPEATGALLETAHSHWVPVKNGDWIVKGWDGGLFAWSDEDFRERYEPYAAPPPVDRDALALLAATWAEPGNGATMTHDEIIEQHIYEECARELRDIIGGAQ